MLDSDIFKTGDVTGAIPDIFDEVVIFADDTGKKIRGGGSKIPPRGFGDLVAPMVAEHGNVPVFDDLTGTGGKLGDSGKAPPPRGFGDTMGPASATNNTVPLFNGTTGNVLKNSYKVLPDGVVVGTTDQQVVENKSFKTQYMADTNWSAASTGLEVRATSSAAGAFMTFHRNTLHGSNFGVDNTNTLRWAGWDLGSNVPWSVSATGHMKIWRSITFPTLQEVTATTANTLIDFNVCQKMHLRLNTNTTVSFAFPGIGHYQIIIYQTTANMTITWPGGQLYWLGSATAHPINLATNSFTVVNIYHCAWGTMMSATKLGYA